MQYKLFVPAQAVGANLVYFDLFNVNAGMKLQALRPIVSGAVAVTGLVGVDLFLTRTTSVGTGGTAATSEGTSLTAMTISSMDGTQLIDMSSCNARLTPSGGATAGAVIDWCSVSTEETGAGTYTPSMDMVRGRHATNPDMLIPSRTGIRVVQSSVASVGNIGFVVFFSVW